MNQTELLLVLKELVVENISQASPGHAEELEKLRSIVSEQVTLDSPLASLGWDSMQMTWLLVRVEDRFKIDTSHLSLFDLYSVGDLLSELDILIQKRGQ